MHIDWLTFGAQLVNFTILVALMRRFLFRPLMAAAAARQERLRSREEAVDALDRHAREREATLAQREAELTGIAPQLLLSARKEVDEERSRALAQAHAEVEAAERSWKASLETRRQRFRQELQRRTAALILQVSERALAGLTEAGGSRLEPLLVSRLLRCLSQVEESDRNRMSGPLGVLTSLELSLETRRELENELDRLGLLRGAVTYELAPELVFGVALRCGAFRLEWSVQAYFSELLSALDEVRP